MKIKQQFPFQFEPRGIPPWRVKSYIGSGKSKGRSIRLLEGLGAAHDPVILG